MPYLEVLGKQIKITNPDKIYWPQTGATKGQMLEYYIKAAPLLLPGLLGRLVALQRFPHGVSAPGFYQKNCPDSAPDWLKTYDLPAKKGKGTRYILVEDLPTLVWLANSGVIEFHPWLSSIGSLDKPDFAVFDLDPMELYGMEEVRQIALAIGDLLTQLGLQGQVKTSGATGLQIFVPVKPIYSYPQIRDFVHACSHLIQRKFSCWTTLERTITKRQGKIYLDYLQNARGQTIVAAYSLRAQPTPTFSQPLLWEDLERTIDPRVFSMESLPEAGKSRAWNGIIPKQSLDKAAEKIKSML